MTARPLSPLVRRGLYWIAALLLALRISPAPAADSDPLADWQAIEREAQAQRAIVDKKQKRQLEPARMRLAELAIRSSEGLEGALALGKEPLVTSYKEQLTQRFHDTRWRLGQMSKTSGAAEFALAVLALHGVLEPQDTAKACAGFARALERKYAGAKFRLSQCLRESDPGRATKLLTEAANAGHLTASELAARACLEAKPRDEACAFDRLQLAAAGGRPSAQSLLGWMYAQGIGGRQDLVRAARLYALAAREGDASAQSNLGELYETGRGLKADPKQALTYYKMASESGSSVGQFNYGRALAAGLGGEANPREARLWLLKAEGAGIAQARTLLDWLESRSSGRQGTAEGVR